jgi:hypothetical protein
LSREKVKKFTKKQESRNKKKIKGIIILLWGKMTKAKAQMTKECQSSNVKEMISFDIKSFGFYLVPIPKVRNGKEIKGGSSPVPTFKIHPLPSR